MNSVSLIGNICSEIELKETNSVDVVRFTLAVYESDEHTNFIRCVAFDKTANLISKHFEKGSKIGICGKIKTDSYENKDGDTVFTTDVIVNSISFCERAEKRDGKKTKKYSKR